MVLAQYYPGVSVTKIVENTSFSIDVSGATEAPPPSEEVLRILREEVDPQRLIL